MDPRKRPLFRALLITGLLAVAPASILTAQEAAAAKVRAGDRFIIRIDRDSMTSHPVVIDHQSSVELPFVGARSLAELSAAGATDSVRASLRTFLRAGSFSVTFERRIAVLGEVRRPDLYYVDLSVGLRAAIARAGGVSESGRAHEVLLLRNGVQERIRNWGTSEAASREIFSGDELIVPREPWIKRNALAVVSGVGVLASILITIATR